MFCLQAVWTRDTDTVSDHSTKTSHLGEYCLLKVLNFAANLSSASVIESIIICGGGNYYTPMLLSSNEM